MTAATIKTVEGKDVNFSDIYIQVSDNRYIESGYAVSLKMKGKLPRCRKDSILHLNYVINDNVYVGPLYGYGQPHQINKKAFLKLISTLPVVGYNKLEITPEIEAMALQYYFDLYN